MHPFRNQSLQFKIALMGGVLVTAFLGLGLLYASSVNTLINANQLLGNTQVAIKESSAFLESVLQMDTTLREFLLNGDEGLRFSYNSENDQAASHLRELQRAVADPNLRLPMDPLFTHEILGIQAAWESWKIKVANPYWRSHRKADQRDLVRFLRASESQIEKIRNEVGAFALDQETLNYKRSVATAKAAETALQTAISGSILTLLLVLLGFSGLTRSIVEPLLNLTAMSQGLAAGDYSQRAPVTSRNELGRLAASFNIMAENLETVRREQASIRSRLEALNRLAAYVSRSLRARDRAEAVVMTLKRDFGAVSAQMWLPQPRQGWICIETKEGDPVEYHLFSSLPDRFQSIASNWKPEQVTNDDLQQVEWNAPLSRADRLNAILSIVVPMDQWEYTEPLLSSINRLCASAFELARVYDEVSSERRRLAAILSNTGEGVIVRDREGRLVLANPAALHLLRIKEKALTGRPLSEALEGDEYAPLRHFIESPFRENAQAETSDPLPFGAQFITATRSLIRDNTNAGVVVVLRDITQQVEVDRMKSEFVSTVSHELRTPLTSIKGSLGLLLGGASGELPEKAVQLLKIAQNNSDRLIRLINDILDISKIESGKVQMERKPVDMAEVARSAAEGLEGMARDAEVRIELRLPPNERLPVLGDFDRLVQVTTNLLSNAVKFSPKRSVVTLLAEARDHLIEIDVLDEGPGIPLDRQEKLFQKFYQVDSSSARAKSGTGLGLAISHAIVKEHGGLIGVENREQVGSRFWFTLPPLRETPVIPPAVALPDAPRVLVCDDDPDVVHLITLLLGQRGYRCDAAYSGEEALEKARQVGYQLITLDLLMPGMDGLEAARQLDADPKTKEIPIVFITASEESEKARRMRVAGWVIKPIDENRLQETIRQALRLDPAIAQREPNGARPIILLADDDPDVLSVIGEMVRSAGMDARTASSGREALEMIGQEIPDAIVLDLMMPEPDGFQVMKALRRNEATRHVPILVLTARDLSAEERGLLNDRRTRLLTKTFASQEAIIEDLTRLLQNKGTLL
jgi:PAS domain S-box-containing protein